MVDQSRDEHDEKRQERTEPRQREAEKRLGPVGLRHEQQGLIHELHKKADDPDHGEDRQPHEDAGDEISAQRARSRRGRHRCFRRAVLTLGRAFGAALGVLLRASSPSASSPIRWSVPI